MRRQMNEFWTYPNRNPAPIDGPPRGCDLFLYGDLHLLIGDISLGVYPLGVIYWKLWERINRQISETTNKYRYTQNTERGGKEN